MDDRSQTQKPPCRTFNSETERRRPSKMNCYNDEKMSSWQWRVEKGRHLLKWHAKNEVVTQSADQYLASRPLFHSLQIHNCRAINGGMLRATQWCGRTHARHLIGGNQQSCSLRNNLSAATPMCTDLDKLQRRNVRISTSRNITGGNNNALPPRIGIHGHHIAHG